MGVLAIIILLTMVILSQPSPRTMPEEELRHYKMKKRYEEEEKEKERRYRRWKD